VIVELRIPPRRIAIAWHGERYETPAARAFVETAREVCAEIAVTLAPATAMREPSVSRKAARPA
jgi:hypothetical protein